MTPPIIETPHGSIINSPTMKATLTWNPAMFSGPGGGTGGAQSWQGRFSAAQWFVDNEVLRLCEPYVPLRTGMLVMSGILGTNVGEGVVSWIAPYAHAQYYGKRAPGSETGPLRGPQWFERMKAVSGPTIIAGARRKAGGQ
jgi:hypothetical protein